MFKPVRKSVDSRASLLSRNYLFHRWPERELFFFSYWLQEASYASVSMLPETLVVAPCFSPAPSLPHPLSSVARLSPIPLTLAHSPRLFVTYPSPISRLRL